MKRLALVLLIAGCGRVEFDPLADGGLVCPPEFVRTGESCYRADYYDAVCTSLDDTLCEYDGRQPVPAAWGQ